MKEIKKENLEKMTGVQIEQTDVTHIIRTHIEGKNHSQIITLEQSDDFSKWFIQTVNGDLVQLEKYQKLINKED